MFDIPDIVVYLMENHMFDIPDYVPQVKGFWNDNGEKSNYSIRTNWVNDNIACDGVKRLFGCWCLKSVLHLYENLHPDDKTVRDTIEVAERFSFNEVTREELEKASNKASWVAIYANARVYIIPYVSAYVSAPAADTSYVIDAAADVANVADDSYVINAASARMNQNRALSLFKKPDNAPNDETLKLLCKYWYYDDRNLFFPIIDRLIELGLEDYRVRLMDENPECYKLGMWPFTPEMILK